jgi:hypothetical protein
MVWLVPSTLDSRAKSRGIEVFDSALPQAWYDRATDLTGENPSGHVVWCYDASLLGYPRAVDEEGDRIVGRMAGQF